MTPGRIVRMLPLPGPLAFRELVHDWDGVRLFFTSPGTSVAVDLEFPLAHQVQPRTAAPNLVELLEVNQCTGAVIDGGAWLEELVSLGGGLIEPGDVQHWVFATSNALIEVIGVDEPVVRLID